MGKPGSVKTDTGIPKLLEIGLSLLVVKIAFELANGGSKVSKFVPEGWELFKWKDLQKQLVDLFEPSTTSFLVKLWAVAPCRGAWWQDAAIKNNGNRQ